MPLQWQRCQTVTTSHADDVCGRNSHPLLGECRLVQPLWQFLTRLTIMLSCSLAIELLDIYPNTIISCVYISSKITWMFMAALFIISKTWK